MESTTLHDIELIKDASGEDQDRCLVFTIADQDYAIEINYVTEIIEMQPITIVPSLPSCMKGIINLRGAIIPLMDVRLRFGLEEQEHTDRTCIIVVDNDGVKVGMIVDAVQEVTDIPTTRRMPPPGVEVGGSAKYIKGVGNENGAIQLILDCDQMMILQV